MFVFIFFQNRVSIFIQNRNALANFIMDTPTQFLRHFNQRIMGIYANTPDKIGSMGVMESRRHATSKLRNSTFRLNSSNEQRTIQTKEISIFISGFTSNFMHHTLEFLLLFFCIAKGFHSVFPSCYGTTQEPIPFLNPIPFIQFKINTSHPIPSTGRHPLSLQESFKVKFSIFNKGQNLTTINVLAFVKDGKLDLEGQV